MRARRWAHLHGGHGLLDGRLLFHEAAQHPQVDAVESQPLQLPLDLLPVNSKYARRFFVQKVLSLVAWEIGKLMSKAKNPSRLSCNNGSAPDSSIPVRVGSAHVALTA